MSNNMNDILTVRQIAEKLQVNTETVYRWLRDGKLTGYRANRLWRVSEQDLEAFLQRKREPARTRETHYK